MKSWRAATGGEFRLFLAKVGSQTKIKQDYVKSIRVYEDIFGLDVAMCNLDRLMQSGPHYRYELLQYENRLAAIQTLSRLRGDKRLEIRVSVQKFLYELWCWRFIARKAGNLPTR